MRRSITAAVPVALAWLLLAASPSSASVGVCTGAAAPLEECTASVSLAHSPLTITSVRTANASGNVGHRFVRGTVERACLDFAFTDALSPGEWLRIYLGGRDTGGFENVGGVDQTSRTICWTSDFHPEVLAHFTDGREHVGLKMQEGKVVVGSLTMRITGRNRGPS